MEPIFWKGVWWTSVICGGTSVDKLGFKEKERRRERREEKLRKASQQQLGAGIGTMEK